jgi:hypothetical protein
MSEPEYPPLPPNPYETIQSDPYDYGSNDLPEPPLEDPGFQEGTLVALVLTFKRVLFQWDRIFPGMREDRSPLPSLLVAFSCLLGVGILNLLISMAMGGQEGFHVLLEQLQEAFPDLEIPQEALDQSMAMGSGMQLLILPIMVVVQFGIGLGLSFAASQLFRSHRGSFSKFARMYSYSLIPFLFGPSLLSLFMWVYSKCILAAALIKGEGASPASAIGTVLAPMVAGCCLCAGCFLVLMATLGGLAGHAG